MILCLTCVRVDLHSISTGSIIHIEWIFSSGNEQISPKFSIIFYFLFSQNEKHTKYIAFDAEVYL